MSLNPTFIESTKAALLANPQKTSFIGIDHSGVPIQSATINDRCFLYGVKDGNVVFFVGYGTEKIKDQKCTTITSAWRNESMVETKGFLKSLYFTHLMKIHGAMITAKKYSPPAAKTGETIMAMATVNGCFVSEHDGRTVYSIKEL